MSVSKYRVALALSSFKQLNVVLPQLNEAEVMAALELESSTRRRRSVIDRLISRAVRLNEISFNQSLQEKYYGTSSKSTQDHDPR